MEQYPKEQIIFRLVNYKNSFFTLLFTLPHRKYLDLAIVYEIAYVTHTGQMSEPVRYSHLKKWNIDETALYEAAKQNTERILGYEQTDIYKHLSKFLADLEAQMNVNKESEEYHDFKDMVTDYMNTSDYSPVYLIGNKNGRKGASCILYKDTLKNLAEKFAGDFYLIPSKDEMVAIPAEKIKTLEDIKNLAGLMYEMNFSLGSVREWLSDTLYYYSRKTKVLDQIAGISIGRRKKHWLSEKW